MSVYSELTRRHMWDCAVRQFWHSYTKAYLPATYCLMFVCLTLGCQLACHCLCSLEHGATSDWRTQLQLTFRFISICVWIFNHSSYQYYRFISILQFMFIFISQLRFYFISRFWCRATCWFVCLFLFAVSIVASEVESLMQPVSFRSQISVADSGSD